MSFHRFPRLTPLQARTLRDLAMVGGNIRADYRGRLIYTLNRPTPIGQGRLHATVVESLVDLDLVTGRAPSGEQRVQPLRITAAGLTRIAPPPRTPPSPQETHA